MAIRTTTISTRAERDDTTTADPSMPTVLAVVVTHDGRTWLRDCLIALANQSYPLLDVVVIDDASPRPKEDPRLKRIAKRHLRRRRWGYVRTPRPLGYGGAINWALSRVRTDADYLLFIHDDAALSKESVEHMVERLRSDEQVAVVGPKIVLWDDPQILEEVGMAVDRFGYPYKGLEEGEIDLGQHDRASEVFFVTSTCMLIRHEIFKRLRGWDARLGAFSEDLDLCWRARLMGYTVRLEPEATARHAIAMATGQRHTRFSPARYFIRRNRLRVIAKNVSTPRLLLLFPQFFLVAFAEMLGFLILRQPREVGHLARALGWNLLRLPQTLSERGRVQRDRSVPDKVLQRLTVRETARIRVYVANQAERLEEAWGRRAEIVSERATRARVVSRSLHVWPAAATALLFVGLLLGFRHFLWAPPAALGELLPFPPQTNELFGAWVSQWQDSGLGHPGPAPPAFFALGVIQLLALGASSAAQKLLIVVLGGLAFYGASRLLSELVDRPARLIAGAVYVLGAVGYAGMRTGSLGALVFGAMAPFALRSLLRFAGWARPPRWSANREGARLAVATALSAAIVPGALFLYLFAAVVLTVSRALLGRPVAELKALAGSVAGLALGWVLLLPWSAGWFSDGGPLSVLRGER
ncbi:MAG: glycosyltransferase family 2 protein, partial [Actinomycetota bacterium]